MPVGGTVKHDPDAMGGGKRQRLERALGAIADYSAHCSLLREDPEVTVLVEFLGSPQTTLAERV